MARPQTHLIKRVRCIKSWKIYFDALATSSKFFFKNDKETWTDKERKSSIKKLYMLIRSLGILCAYQPENRSLQHQTAQITIMSSHSKRPQCSLEDIGQCSCLLYQNMVAILRVYSFAQFIFIKLKRPENNRHKGNFTAPIGQMALIYLGRGAWGGGSVVAMLASSYISSSQSAYSTAQSCRSHWKKSPNLFHNLWHCH